MSSTAVSVHRRPAAVFVPPCTAELAGAVARGPLESVHDLSIADRSVSTNGIIRVRSSQRPVVTRSAASRVVKLTGGNEYDLSRASPPPRPRSPITGTAAARRPSRSR